MPVRRAISGSNSSARLSAKSAFSGSSRERVSESIDGMNTDKTGGRRFCRVRLSSIRGASISEIARTPSKISATTSSGSFGPKFAGRDKVIWRRLPKGRWQNENFRAPERIPAEPGCRAAQVRRKAPERNIETIRCTFRPGMWFSGSRCAVARMAARRARMSPDTSGTSGARPTRRQDRSGPAFRATSKRSPARELVPNS